MFWVEEATPSLELRAQASRGAVGQGDMERATRANDPTKFMDETIRCGKVLEAVLQDRSVHRGRLELEFSEISHMDVETVFTTLLSRSGVVLDADHPATPRLQVEKEVSVPAPHVDHERLWRFRRK